MQFTKWNIFILVGFTQKERIQLSELKKKKMEKKIDIT